MIRRGDRWVDPPLHSRKTKESDMAIIDRENNYSGASGQTIVATGPSTDVIDHRLDRDMGIGEPLAVVVVPRAVPDAADGNETYVFQVQTDDNSGFGSPASIGPAVTIVRGSAAGLKYVVMLPPDTTWERFSRISWTLGGTTPSITYEGWLTTWRAIQNDAYYADAITIG
jgi:hypothetical protein